MFDSQHIRRSFGRAADSYQDAAGLQREVEGWLLESLMYLDDTVPATVVDLGSGPGHASAEMRRRWPKARIVAVDLALPMLQRLDPRAGGGLAGGLGLRRGIDPASKEGELALLFLRLYRSLDALVGGDDGRARAWLTAQNDHLGGVPAERLTSVQGLVDVVQYLDAMRGRL